MLLGKERSTNSASGMLSLFFFSATNAAFQRHCQASGQVVESFQRHSVATGANDGTNDGWLLELLLSTQCHVCRYPTKDRRKSIQLVHLQRNRRN